MAHGYPDYTFFSSPVNVAGGGTGLSTVPVGAMLIGNGTASMNVTSAGSAGQVLRIPDAGGNPDFGAVDLGQAAAVAGILPFIHGGTGTATPALVPGSNIVISGSWPNNTISVADPFIAPGLIEGGTNYPSQTVQLDLSSQATYGASTFSFPHGGQFNTVELSIAGTNDVFFQGFPATTAGYVYIEAWSSAGLILGTGNNTNPIIFKINRVQAAALTNGGNLSLNSVTAGTQHADTSTALLIGTSHDTNGWTQLGTGTTTIAGVPTNILGVASQGQAWLAALDGSGNMGLAGTLHLSSALSVPDGGTGVAACSAGQLLIGSGVNTAAFTTPDGARVYNNANQSINNTTYTALTFNSERYNQGPMHNTGSNTSRLTAQHAGKYVITGHVQFALNTTGTRELLIRLNGATYIASHGQPTDTATGTQLSVTTVFLLNVNDYVELIAYQDSGGGLNVLAAGDYSPEFAAQWLGP